MNIRKIVRTSGVGSALFLLANQASAALPADVTAAIGAAKADGIELAGLLLSLAVAVGVILWLKRKA